MTGKITIDAERCKGCNLCVEICPKNCISVSKYSNNRGYFPVQSNNIGCTGCAMCAVICPDVTIEVSRDSNIVAVGQSKKNKPSLVRETR